MLRELSGVVVEEIAKGIDCLCHSCGEEGLLLRQIFGERYERVKCPCLYDARRQQRASSDAMFAP